MADFITPQTLTDFYREQEIAQRADNESNPPITGAQLLSRLAGGDLGSAPLNAQADRAIARIQTACNYANAVATSAIESGLNCPALPDPLPNIPPNVAQHAHAIGRYVLYDDGVPADIRLNYEDALTFFTAVGNGKIKLDLQLPVEPLAGNLNIVRINLPWGNEDSGVYT